jgi:3-hydroxy-5-methyl-1-naphthoate 3-O-methyltransferase
MGQFDPSAVMQMTTAYWSSQALFTANRLGLFEAIADGCHQVDEIAAACNAHARPLRLLLQACVSLGLLEQTGGEFFVSPMSEVLLVPGHEAYLGNAIRYSDDLYATWARLEIAVRDNAPQLATKAYTGEDEARTRHFVRGMHDRALGIGNAMVELVDMQGRQQMLDVGGGPGTYSSLFTRQNPGLAATVLDLPGVVAVAREIVEEMGASEQVKFLAGDFNSTDFPAANDVVLISGVFHRESEAGCRALIERAQSSLLANGMLIVSDVFTDAGGCSPPFAALFGLNMLLTAEDGCVHADADICQWMADAGFIRTECKSFPAPMPHRLVIGHKS